MQRPCHVNVHFYDLDGVKNDYIMASYIDARLNEREVYLSPVTNTMRLALNRSFRVGHRRVYCIRPLTDWCRALSVNDPMVSATHISHETFVELLRLDYPKMRVKNASFRDQLLRHVMHPSRLHKTRDLGLV